MKNKFVNIHTHTPAEQDITPISAGIHPWDAEKSTADIEALLSTDVEVIGEIGLDFACDTDHRMQEDLFRQQLDKAAAKRLPVVIHCVRAFEPVMNILAEYSLPAVIFHGFVGSSEQAQRAITKGYFLSFGLRTFSSPRTMEALRMTPSENLFLETDDSPIDIREIYRQVADARETSIDELKEVISENYKRIFRKNNG